MSAQSILEQTGDARWGRRIGLGLGGLALLMWPYTMLLGITILVLVTVATVAPQFLPSAAAHEYRHSPYLQRPVTYGVSEEGVWVRGATLAAESSWAGVAVWQANEPWLVLSASGMPRVYLPVRELQAAGIYEQVIALARAHALEYDSPEARRATL